MAVAVLAGVWVSTRIGMGEAVEGNRAFRWWVVNRLAFLVGANNLASFMVFFLQEKFVPYQGERAAGPASQIIMFVGLFILLTALPSGWLADRYGRKMLIAVSGVLATVGVAIAVLAPSLQVLFVGACLIGAGVGLFYSANWALGTAIVPSEKAGQFLGLSNLAGAGAGAIGAYIGGPIADQNSYVLLMSIYGGVMFLSLFALLGIRSPRSTVLA
jgi:MFS family permease